MSESKSLGKWDVYLATICAMLFADVIVSNTSMGASVLTWWFIIGVLFFIPNSLLTAELSAAYPDKGGIYGWIDKAFGHKWAARTTFYYWINIAIWGPSSYVWLAGVILKMLYPNSDYRLTIILGMVILCFVIFISSRNIAESKWIVNLGAISKILIFGLVTTAGISYMLKGNAVANELSISTLRPTFSEGLAFLPVILYCCCGVELISANAHEMKNPKRDLPRAIITVVALTLGLNLLASWSVLSTIPLEKLNLVTGLNDMFMVGFNSEILANFAVIILLLAVFSQLIAWTANGSRCVAQAGISGEMPAIFGKESKSGAPVGACIMNGVVSTTVFILYAFLSGSSAELFWVMLSFSSIIFFFPYVIMLQAYIKLKKTDSDTPRPFNVPLGSVFAVICEIILIIGIILFIWAPGYSFVKDSFPLIVGVVVVCVIGEIIVAFMSKKKEAMKVTFLEVGTLEGK